MRSKLKSSARVLSLLLLSAAATEAAAESEQATSRVSPSGDVRSEASDDPVGSSPLESENAQNVGEAHPVPERVETSSKEGTLDSKVEAAQRYDRGLELYEEGQFELAAIEFERAYELVPNFRALYNIGQVRTQLGDYVRAHSAFEQYLSEGGERVDAERKSVVRKDLQMLLGRMGSLLIAVNVDDADILLDGHVIGRSPLDGSLRVNAGEHQLEVRKTGYDSRIESIVLAGRDSLKLDIKLTEVPKASPQVVFRPAEEEDSSALLWASWSTTGACVLGAGVLGILGATASSTLEKKRAEEGATRGELDSAARRASTLLIAADIVGGLALVSGGVATYLTLREPTERDVQESGSGVGVALTGSGVSLFGGF